MSEARLIEEQAARWLSRADDPAWTTSDQAALQSWLDQSFAHKAAYWRLKAGWASADRLRALQADEPIAAPTVTRWRPAMAASIAAAIGLATLCAGLVGFGGRNSEPAGTAVATAVGARKVVHLGDGSAIDINTASAVRVAFDRSRRDVWLDRGEAFFDVAHDPERPFVVHAGAKDIVVLGTRFAVRHDGPRVTVSVVEGRVRIRDAGRSGATSAIATDGAIAIAERGSTLIASDAPARVEQALSWRRGALVFDNSTLATAAAEFNRYNQRKIVIADPAIRDIRVGGTFSPTNADAFARILRDAYGFTVRSDDAVITISKA